MSDLEDARAILEIAERDLRALRGMTDPAVFADEIFGFHAQQATEKALKALIIARGLEHPLTHNLARLLAILEESGADVQSFWPLAELTVFAVAMRYESEELSDDLIDRAHTIKDVGVLVDHVGSELS